MKAVFSFIYLVNVRNRSDGAVADLYYDTHFISLKSNSFKCTMSKVKKQNKRKASKCKLIAFSVRLNC